MKTIEKDQPRWQSKVLWGAIVSQILALLLINDVIEVGLAEQVRESAAIILQLLVLVGVLNNPTDKEHF